MLASTMLPAAWPSAGVAAAELAPAAAEAGVWVAGAGIVWQWCLLRQMVGCLHAPGVCWGSHVAVSVVQC